MKLKTALTVACLVGIALPAHADGDAEAGEKVFRKCKACHMIGEGAKPRVGPPLTGVVGAEVASNEDFKYSDAFMAKKEEGMVWSEDNLAAYLENPRDFIPGNKMSFAGLRKEEDRADVIAYLETFE
ncbi:cytochrome c family protein [Maritimibacter sp. 55A14]|uniref:c-type cytochrome n=1 Tax=Maritimibacter sp. 55A14 TaxID=2174844 RepID=UPI000D60D6D8|nr:cytochrome c family protein [Maritimibacter sp. 55A14]PWE34342.1 cytochrome c family protein [Maritimibacter sp. 55A14]